MINKLHITEIRNDLKSGRTLAVPVSPAQGLMLASEQQSIFPPVIVWVWHGEPGNMHPCNSDAQITYLPSLNYPKQIWSRTSPHKNVTKM